MSSKYFDKLKTFMNNYKTSDKYTHLSYGDFTGKFNIPFDKSKEFIKMYNKAIAYGIDNLNILEIQPEYAPIFIKNIFINFITFL